MSERLYRWVLRVHPRAFRERYEADLIECYREGLRTSLSRGGTPWRRRLFFSSGRWRRNHRIGSTPRGGRVHGPGDTEESVHELR